MSHRSTGAPSSHAQQPTLPSGHQQKQQSGQVESRWSACTLTVINNCMHTDAKLFVTLVIQFIACRSMKRRITLCPTRWGRSRNGVRWGHFATTYDSLSVPWLACCSSQQSVVKCTYPANGIAIALEIVKHSHTISFLQNGSGYLTWNVDHTSAQKHPDEMAVRPLINLINIAPTN